MYVITELTVIYSMADTDHRCVTHLSGAQGTSGFDGTSRQIRKKSEYEIHPLILHLHI